MWKIRNSKVYAFNLVLCSVLLFFGIQPALSQNSAHGISAAYRRADGLCYAYFDIFGGSPSFEEIMDVANWCAAHQSKRISRCLPIPVVGDGNGYDLSGKHMFGDWCAGQRDGLQYDYNRNWENSTVENLVAHRPHAWLLGQLKSVALVEAFAPYESEKVLIPVFEEEDSYKLPSFIGFCYERPAKYLIRATRRCEGQENKKNRERTIEIVRTAAWLLLAFLTAGSVGYVSRRIKNGW